MKTPTKTTIRTAIQWTVSVAVVLPEIVDASGIPEALPWVAGGLALAAGVTRVMALPSVQGLLSKLGLATDVPPGPTAPYRLRDGQP